MKLNSAQLLKFHDQILIVLADYQNTVPANCPTCHRPFVAVHDVDDWTRVIMRARLLDEPPPDAGHKYCPECGADAYGFARGESVRTEVAQRIMENLALCAKLQI